MANVNAATTAWNSPNYTGTLYLIGANQTPFLNMIGGLEGGKVRLVSSMQFALGSTYALESAAQPAITETASLTAPSPWTYVRGQDVNTCQIFQKQVSVSYLGQSLAGAITADPTTGLANLDPEGNQAADELSFQEKAALRQIALEVEYTFLNGVYQQASDAGTAAKCRGIITACASNAVDAVGAALDKDLIDQLMRTMADNGAQFTNVVCFVNALQKQKLSALYGYAPADRRVGGVNIKQIETDFCEMGVVWAPQVPAGTLLVADLDVCHPVFNPVPGKGALFIEDLSKTGASDSRQIYGQIGLDYGPEEYHGVINNLATS